MRLFSEPTLRKAGALAGVWLLLAAAAANAQSGAESSVGYIDSAVPQTTVRLRYDSAYDTNRPDRAEFFYPQSFNPINGPAIAPAKVDDQELTAYVEWAFCDRFSGFVEVPERFVEAESNPATAGLGDINAGFKWAVVAEDEGMLTFQFRTYAPTGAGRLGLGTNHVSLEPALLFNRHLSEQVLLEGEFRDWIPIGGSAFEGNVVRYGLGVSYEFKPTSCFKIAPVVEFVGWTVFGGQESAVPPDVPISANGNTIVNAKVGLRATLGDLGQVYVGYGRALTGDFWYKDILRVEYRLTF